jgi:hypothetical protein
LIEISQFVKIFDPEVPQKVTIMLRNLDKSQKSQQILKISTNLENLDSLDENLDAAKSRLKSLYLKNLDKKKIVVSTLRTVSISISIGIDCQDPQA